MNFVSMEAQPVKLAESATRPAQKGFKEDSSSGELSSPRNNEHLYIMDNFTQLNLSIGNTPLLLSTSNFVNLWISIYVGHYGAKYKDREPIARRTALPEKMKVYDQSNWMMQ